MKLLSVFMLVLLSELCSYTAKSQFLFDLTDEESYVNTLSMSSPDIVLFENVRVIDGDTIAVNMPELKPPLNKIYIRVNGIDTPEIRGKCELEKRKAKEAKEFTKTMISKSNNKIIITGFKWDKYGGRILADVYVYDLEGKVKAVKMLSKMLVDKGLAVEYHGVGKKKDWCTQ